MNVNPECPGCGSQSAAVVRRGCRDVLLNVSGEWTILRCEQCQLKFTHPRPGDDELSRHYPSSYHVYSPPSPVRNGRVGAVIRRVAMMPYTLRFGAPDWTIAPFGNGRFLDVGCGAGGVLQRMSAHGWKCAGIDLSADAVRAARRAAPDAAVEQATLETYRPHGTFAAISLQHVLEHLPRPLSSLTRCRELLEPDGCLLVSVPNIESFEARAFRSRWIGLDIPRHLTHFSRTTLTELIRRAGFDVVRVRPAMFASSLSESAALSMPLDAGRRLVGSRVGRLLYFASVLPAAVSYAFGNEPVLEVLSRRTS